MLINYYWNGNEFIELREPVASWHIRFLRLFELLNNSQNDNEKYQACLTLLSKMLFEAKITDSLIPVEQMTVGFVNEVLSLFTPIEIPDLSALTDLLEDTTSTEYLQSSNNFEAYWLNTLTNLFRKQSLTIWKTTSLSTIQALVFDSIWSKFVFDCVQ